LTYVLTCRARDKKSLCVGKYTLKSPRRSGEIEEPTITLIAPAWPTAMLGSSTQLFVADHRQHCSKPLVVGDYALVDVANFIEAR
jgi:hypothetical protein